MTGVADFRRSHCGPVNLNCSRLTFVRLHERAIMLQACAMCRDRIAIESVSFSWAIADRLPTSTATQDPEYIAFQSCRRLLEHQSQLRRTPTRRCPPGTAANEVLPFPPMVIVPAYLSTSTSLPASALQPHPLVQTQMLRTTQILPTFTAAAASNGAA